MVRYPFLYKLIISLFKSTAIDSISISVSGTRIHTLYLSGRLICSGACSKVWVYLYLKNGKSVKFLALFSVSAMLNFSIN